jgi:DNA-binding NarL/FixJ family response regulator
MSKVLIVDDSTTFRQSLKRVLCAQFPCIDVSEAADGRQALKEIDTLRPSLIFMDIRLPGENGLELTTRIKTDRLKAVVVILTNYDLPEYRQAAYQSGADYFLTKDSSAEALLELVERILPGQRLNTRESKRGKKEP